MIAIDTNILLRYIVQDDPAQSPLATEFLENRLSETSRGFVSLVVVCEIVWALDKTYGLGREVIATAVAALLESPQLEVEAGKTVKLSLDQSQCGIADAIIHFIGRARDCTSTLTFDRKFARLEGVELLL